MITEVRVRILKEKEGSKLRGVATITIDTDFAIHDIRILEGDKGMFIAMPSKKTPKGEYRDIAHPIRKEVRADLEERIFAKYNEELEKAKAELIEE